MNALVLIAETPNAGHYGHRFLVSDPAGIGDEMASSFISKAKTTRRAIGENYLGVSRNTVQRTSGRTDALEILVLAGVDTPKMNETQIQSLMQTLELLLDRIDPICQQVDWDHEKRLVVSVPSLAANLQVDFTVPTRSINLGPVDSDSGIHDSKRVQGYRSAMYKPVIFLLFLGVCGSISAILRPWESANTKNNVAPTETPNRAKWEATGKKDIDKQLDEITKDIPNIDHNSTSGNLVKLRDKIEQLQKNQDLVIDQKQRLTELDHHFKRTLNHIWTKWCSDLLSKTHNDADDLDKLLLSIDDFNSLEFVEDAKIEKLFKDIRHRIEWLKYKKIFNGNLKEYRFFDAIDYLIILKDIQKQNPEFDLQKCKDEFITTIKSVQITISDGKLNQHFIDARRSLDLQRVKNNFPELVDCSAELDLKEDRDRYNLIGSQGDSKKQLEACRSYLNSQVGASNKIMSEHVQKLKEYLETKDDPKEYTIIITPIPPEKISQSLTLSISQKSKIVRSIEWKPVQPIDKQQLKATFKARITDKFSLEIKPDQPKGKNPPSYLFDNKTLEQLNRPIVESNQKAPQFKIEVQGIKLEPKLLPYKSK